MPSDHISNEQIKGFFALALQSYQHKRLDDSYQLCQKILKFEVNHFDANHLAGVIAMQLLDWDRAYTFFSKALSVNDKNIIIKKHIDSRIIIKKQINLIY
jgi:tetratricopeptide (TPR) repeat protein